MQFVSQWTPEEDELLRKLHAAGLTFEKMKAEFPGKSRSSIAARAMRMGLKRGQRKLTPEEKAKSLAAKRERERIRRREQRGSVPRVARPKRKRAPQAPHRRDSFGKLFAPEPFEPCEVNVESRKLTFDQLETNSCRYPEGGNGTPITFCGHDQQVGSSYCPAHHFLCWKPAKSINREEFHLTRLERFRAYKAELVNA